MGLLDGIDTEADDQAACQVTNIESILCEQKRTGRAAGAGITVGDIQAIGVEIFQLGAQLIERYIDAGFDAVFGMLIGKTQVQPAGAFRNQRFCRIVVNRVEIRLLDELDEIVLGKAHELAIGDHGHGGVALGVRDQGFLTEAVAIFQLRELDGLAAGGCFARHLATPALNDVVVVARLSLLHHHTTGLELDRFHDRENALYIGRRNPREQFRLQHAGHPIATAVLVHFDFADFEASRRGPGVIHGEKAIHHLPGDAHHQQFAFGLGAHLTWLKLGERRLGIGAASLDSLQELAVGLQFQLTVEEVIGVGIHVSLLENPLLFLEFEDLGLLDDLVLVLGCEAADGHQRLDLFGKFLLQVGHSTHSHGRATARDPAHGLVHLSSRNRAIPATIP